MSPSIAKPVTIHVSNGKISCTPNDGHVRGSQGTDLQWVCQDEEFTLSFQLQGEGPAWPFTSRPLQPTKNFKATLVSLPTGPGSPPLPSYKYTVTIGGKVLDPIVIVDK